MVGCEPFREIGMTGVRKDIESLSGPWSEEMLWYARAVNELRSRPFDNRTSWTYLAAIHGLDGQGWLAQGILPQNPPLPPQEEMRNLFNQCQHAGWFFLPWHRGYLHAFESILAEWIAQNGGPADWALPYWNYLNAANPNARTIPQEFLEATLPDGSPNALSLAERGPHTVLGPRPDIPADISLDANADETVYTAEPGTLGYGGPISGFTQQGNAFGAIESDPHNYVHVMVGGGRPNDPQGWMFDPNYAALDPIFWVHHCNIDRLWSAWMSVQTNDQESSSAWANGPFPRQFTMPDAGQMLNIFIPRDTLPGELMDPQYDDLSAGTGLQVGGAGGVMGGDLPSVGGFSELVGASESSLTVQGTPVSSRISLLSGVAAAASGDDSQFRIFLNAEGVRGERASGTLNVSILAPGEDGVDREVVATKTLVFFGLANATSTEGMHAGSGLTAAVDVTDIIRDLGVLTRADIDRLELELTQPDPLGSAITVERLSLYAVPIPN